jgi:cell division protein FtsI/penicillin-binding protein 2
MRQGVQARRHALKTSYYGRLFAVTAGFFVSASGKAARSEHALNPRTEHAERTNVNGTHNVDVSTLHFEGERAYVNDLTGQPLCLLLDKTLQVSASQRLRAAKPKRGALVVLDARDGRVLAAADLPPHTPRNESVLWSALTPSASLFKLVTTAALVERAKLSPSHRVCSEGGEHRVGLAQLEAPKEGQIRCQSFSSILATSRNAAYARLVHRHLTSEDLSNYADRFGFNSSINQDFPLEMGRYAPAQSPLGVARTATGFIGSTLSTFGAAYLGFLIANGGQRKPLRLFCDANDSEDKTAVIRVILPETARRLRDMMETVVQRGTAYDAFHDEMGRPRLPRVSVAAKTGTLGDEDGTNSWFIGFAPSHHPKYVVAVLLDNGTPWYTTAKRVAVEILSELFPEEKPTAQR